MNEGKDRAYEEFVNPGPLPPGANLPDAEARLLTALERELGIPLAAPPLKAPVRRPSRFKPLLAFAAVALAAAGLAWSWGAFERRPDVLRGATAPPGAWVASLQSTRLTNGNARLAWTAEPRATRYEVTILDADLHEVRHLDTPATSVVVAPGGALWRVTAFSARDEIARSSTAPLP